MNFIIKNVEIWIVIDTKPGKLQRCERWDNDYQPFVKEDSDIEKYFDKQGQTHCYFWVAFMVGV